MHYIYLSCGVVGTGFPFNIKGREVWISGREKCGWHGIWWLSCQLVMAVRIGRIWIRVWLVAAGDGSGIGYPEMEVVIEGRGGY